MLRAGDPRGTGLRGEGAAGTGELRDGDKVGAAGLPAAPGEFPTRSIKCDGEGHI